MSGFIDLLVSIKRIVATVAGCMCLLTFAGNMLAQGSAVLGNGLSAAATAHGGTVVAEHSSPLDAIYRETRQPLPLSPPASSTFAPSA